MARAMTRANRLHELEADIQSGIEQFYHTGMKLREIRGDHLYKEAGFETWDEYCRVRWEFAKSYANKLIVASEYRARIPAGTACTHEWTEASVRELARIDKDARASDPGFRGPSKDAVRVAKKIIAEVESTPDVKLTSTTVRRHVDADLGVDRAAKAKETKQQRAEEAEARIPKLEIHLQSEAMDIAGTQKDLQSISPEAWQFLMENNPTPVESMIVACEALAEFLKGVSAAGKARPAVRRHQARNAGAGRCGGLLGNAVGGDV